MRIVTIALIFLLTGCTTWWPPNLLIVKDKAQLGGKAGGYMPSTRTIYLAPGANWEVLQHELDHHHYGGMGEKPHGVAKSWP